MDHERKYNEALEKARTINSGKYVDIPAEDTVLEYVFPELKESEDERIRNGIICGMNALKEQKKATFATIPIDDILAWLEKQCKQKPADKVEPKYFGEAKNTFHRYERNKTT